jgi:hypothetical protein
MANVYIEPRPEGGEGPIEEYVAEDYADRVLATFETQEDGIKWARAHGHYPLVARVRALNDKKKPDHWRSA